MEHNFDPILDAYQLAEGSIVKGKEQDELFEIGKYDADKKAYEAYPYEDGARFDDFAVMISEDELMDNYLIRNSKAADESASDEDLLSDAI